MKGILAIAALVALAAASQAQTFVRAQLIFFRDKDGKSYNPPKQLVITDAAELAKLTKLMPGLGYNQGGLKPGGWAARGTIRLIRKKGPGIQVFFPSDGKRFSILGIVGDFPAGKGLGDYLVDAEAKAKQ